MDPRMKKLLFVSICTVLMGSFGLPQAMEKPTRRPSLPKEWVSTQESPSATSSPFDLLLICSTQTRGYLGMNSLGFAPESVYEQGREQILNLINADLRRSEITKTFDELTERDSAALRRAMQNKTLQEDYQVLVEVKDNAYYCFSPLSSIIDSQTKKYLIGPLEEVLAESNTTGKNMGLAGSHLGNVVYTPSHILNSLFDSVQPGDLILDIGGSRGIQAFPMLSRGANVTVADLNSQDLLALERSLSPDLRNRLDTVVGHFPTAPVFSDQGWLEKYKFILMSHVAHYLTGPELREGLQKIYSWLKPGGFFYFQALTPYSNPYQWRMLIAEGQQAGGHEWPDYFSTEEKQDYNKTNPTKVRMYHGRNMPDYGHPISPRIIQRELEAAGFQVESINYATFSPGLTDIIYPVTYQELERYVKNLVNPIPYQEKEEIAQKLAKYPALLKLANEDAENYANQVQNPEGRGVSLKTMETINVIARKLDVSVRSDVPVSGN